jgi:hypothetical protein
MSGTSSPEQRRKLALEYLAERKSRRPDLVPSRTYVNASIREPYTGSNMGTSRDGANDFQQISSVSIGAQIRRNP